MKFGSLFLSLFAAGILSAQTAPANQPYQSAPADNPTMSHHRMPGGRMMQRLSSRLNLTPDQQNRAKAIFQQSRDEMRAISPQLKQEHQALSSAFKSDNEQQIDQILQKNAQVNTQAKAIHAKTMAKFYQILTPDQKAKFDQSRNRFGSV